MTNHEMYEASFRRPRNYFHLTERRQWEIDASLGILDWDGSDMTEAEKKRFKAHYCCFGDVEHPDDE